MLVLIIVASIIGMLFPVVLHGVFREMQNQLLKFLICVIGGQVLSIGVVYFGTLQYFGKLIP